MSVSLATLRSNEAAALAQKNLGTIDKAEAQALVKDAGTVPENLDALRDMLMRDAFEPGARQIIQAAVGKKDVVAASGVAGMSVGTLPGKVNVSVAKELGDPAGYTNRFEALGNARASGEKNAAAVQGKDGRWHSVQTNVEASGKGFTAANATGLVVPTAQISDAQMQVLKDTAKNLEALVASNPAMKPAADKAWQELVGQTLGVDPAKVKILRDGADPDPNAINFNPNLPAISEARFANKSGYVDQLPANDSEKGKPPRGPHGIVMGLGAFRSPEHAAGVLAHEATHKAHHDVGDQMLATFRQKGLTDFSSWIGKQGLPSDMVDAIRAQVSINTQQVGAHGAAASEVGAYAAEIAATAKRFPADHAEMKKALGTLAAKWPNMTRSGQDVIVGKLRDAAKTLPTDQRAKLEAEVNKLKLHPCACGKTPCGCK